MKQLTKPILIIAVLLVLLLGCVTKEKNITHEEQTKSLHESNTDQHEIDREPSIDSKDLSHLNIVELVEEKESILADKALKQNDKLYTAYTDEKGIWKVKRNSVWTSGFVAGNFWYLYNITGDEKWKEYGVKWTEGNRSRAVATDNDTGFQIFDSFGLAYLIGGMDSEDYKSVLIAGADTLVEQRYNPNIGCFRSWKQSVKNPIIMPFEVNIDQLMNMEIVLWVAKETKNQAYLEFAISHADKSWENNIRENYSSYHVIDYNKDGSVNLKRTHQGWQDESTWSRGQAWAVYAYAVYYRYTGLNRMLDRSIKTMDYFLDATAKQTNDYIPYSDFDAPIDSMNPRDTSAAAIVASAALELYNITKEPYYLDVAEKILLSLTSDEFLSRDSDYQSILLKGSEKWSKPEVGSIFGDYFFIEALYRWKEWSPRPLPDYFGL